jgi:epoxyqueuosine reductase QueG
VFTDLPLLPDYPTELGLTEVCKTCQRCTEACEADAISRDPEPSYEVACVSNNPGIKRWAVNADRCYAFWQKNGASCANCIAACPLTQKVANGVRNEGAILS